MVSNEHEDYFDTVLYDVFYETGTMLGGWLVAVKREALTWGNIAMAAEYEAEHIAMLGGRDDVGAFDRVAQMVKIEQWHVRCTELDAQKVLVASWWVNSRLQRFGGMKSGTRFFVGLGRQPSR